MKEIIKILPRYRISIVKKKRTNKKKTHEEYVTEVAIKNPNIEVVGEYVNAKTKIEHKCLKHDVCFNAMPNNVLTGIGCNKCYSERLSKSQVKSQEQYILEVKNINPNIEVIESYINAKTPILHKCTIHNIEWKAFPYTILKGSGCQECKKNKIAMKHKKSQELYITEVSLINPNIEVVGEYFNANTKLTHKCKSCNYHWDAFPSNILRGTICPRCTNHLKITNQEYMQRLNKINPDIIPLEKIIDIRTPILHKCIKHNIEWITSPSSMLQGSGCLECKSQKIYDALCKTHEQYVSELKNINSNLVVIGKYINSNTPIRHKCLIDNYEWNIRPSKALSGQGCPQCNESKGEKKICQLLDNYNIAYEKQYKFKDCCDIKPLPFDFYVPNYNLCIEYDGEQHFRPIEYFGGQEKFEIQQKHDKIKNEYCNNNGISLLRIPYFKNVEEELNNFLFI